VADIVQIGNARLLGMRSSPSMVLWSNGPVRELYCSHHDILRVARLDSSAF